MEIRTAPTEEIRAFQDEDGGMKWSGHFARYNSRSILMWDFYEEIMPDAFSDVLSGDVRAFWNHDYTQVLGRTTSNTLALSSDDMGVRFSLTLPSWATAYHETVSRGDVTGMSFGFVVSKDSWSKLDDDMWLRTIHKYDALHEISPVTYPAYPSAGLAARGLSMGNDEYQKIVENRQASDHINSARLRNAQIRLLELKGKI